MKTKYFTKYLNKFIALGFAFLVVFATACKEEVEPEGPIAQLTNLSIAKDESAATLSWSPSGDSRTNGYIVQLSTSSTFGSLIEDEQLGSDVSEFTFESLESETVYFARVRATNPYPLHNSPWAEISFTSNEVENIIGSIPNSQIGADWVEIKWAAPVEGSVTKLKLSPASGAALEFDLTPDEIAARAKTIDGLNPVTNYTVEIFDGAVLRGFASFTTRTEDQTISINSVGYENLEAALEAANNGDVIRIKSGNFNYGSESFEIEGKSVTIEAYDEAAEPVITLKNIQLKGDIDHFILKGIKLISTSTSESTDYEKHIFGVTWVTSEIDIQLIDCDFSGAESGIIFSQATNAASLPDAAPGTVIVNLTIDNSLLHDFGNAGGDFIDFRSGTIKTVHMKNSTVWNSARSFFRLDDVIMPADHLLKFESCTFNNISNGGNLFRPRAANAAIVVDKCVITNKGSDHANDVRNGSTLTISNIAYFGTFAARIISNASVSGELNVDPQYANAENGNFTIGNASVKSAGLGDPRWLQ